MSYSYETEKPKLFTEEGVALLRATELEVDRLLKEAGAFRQAELQRAVKVRSDSWQELACLDYLEEQGKIECVRSHCWAQYKVYASPQKSNN